MTKLTLLALLTASTLTTASADGMFSFGDMMNGMTDVVKEVKTKVTDTVTDIKDSATDSVTELKDKVSNLKDTDTKTAEIASRVQPNVSKIKDAPVTVSEDLPKK